MVADNHAIVFELEQKFGYARTRRAYQIRQILVPRNDRDTRAALFLDTEIFAQLEQDQRNPLLERAAHEVRATQLHQIPAAQIAQCHPLEIIGSDPQRDFNELLQFDRPDLTFGDGLAAKVITDAGYRRRKARNHPGRHHDHQNAIALAIAARDARDARQQDVSGVRRMLFVDNDFPFVGGGDSERGGQPVELARGEPGDILQAA
jgi:hypothetical protein